VNQDTRPGWTWIRWAGLIAGPLLALWVYFLLPTEYFDVHAGAMAPFSEAGRATLAVMVWMAVWWLTEAIDISATALLPVVVFPLLGIASIDDTTAPYASSVIFLFLGGFLLALSMQRWGLDRRIALLTLRAVGTRPANMIGGFMLATAVMSAFVSNTATTALMLPIALSVIALLTTDESMPRPQSSDQPSNGGGHNFPLVLMLAIAYAASIGGISTIIGTPPNLFLVGYLRNNEHIDITFLSWLRIGVPLVVVFLPLTWWLLTRKIYPVERRPIAGAGAMIREALRKQGPANRGEKVTFWVFVWTAAAWITRPFLVRLSVGGFHPLAHLSDAGVAMLAGLALFVIPVDARERTFTLDWATARKLPWGVLILFGGGLSLAAAVQANKVAEFLGAQAREFHAWPEVLIVLLICAATIFLTELTSNTATAATLVPILAALAPGLGVPLLRLVIPAALAASCAFMLPVATPPNAIVFGSGQVTIPQMARAGLWLNLIAIVLIVGLAYSGLILLSG
jgi:sodium-dependent dicarboxylate transporter 2/3/5